MIKNFIFDIDGTLVDSKQSTFKSADYALKKVGYPPLSPEDKIIFSQSGFEGLIKIYKVRCYLVLLIIFFFRRYKLKHLSNIQSFPGILETIEKLSNQHKTLGILSSNPLRIINRILANNKLNTFSFVQPAGFLGKISALKKVLKKHQLNPSETVYVGDELHDIVAARTLGIKSAAVSWGFNTPKSLSASHPDYLIKSPEGLLEIN